jgi:hypothetical protein
MAQLVLQSVLTMPRKCLGSKNMVARFWSWISCWDQSLFSFDPRFTHTHSVRSSNTRTNSTFIYMSLNFWYHNPYPQAREQRLLRPLNRKNKVNHRHRKSKWTNKSEEITEQRNEFVNEYILCLAMGLSQAENPKAITKVLNSCKAGEF